MLTCQWCGQPILSSGMWKIDGEGRFCSERCCNEWEREHNQVDPVDVLLQEARAERQRGEELRREESRKYLAAQDAEREHFRPFIEKRLGHPLNLVDIWYNRHLNTWLAKEEVLAEASAAMKALEKETGVPVSAIIPLTNTQKDFEMLGDNWYFPLPKDMWMHFFSRSSESADDNGDMISFVSYLHSWSDAESLSPYIALAEYEGKKIQDVTDFSEYVWAVDHSCLISITELKQKLKWKEGVYSEAHDFITFSNIRNLFYLDHIEWKEDTLFKKAHNEKTHREISLDELELRIPVKKIVPAAVSNEMMAEDYYKQGANAENVDEAIALVTKSIALNPNFVDAYFNRGNNYLMQKKDYDKAIADFTQAIKLEPNCGTYKELLATSYNNRGIVQYNKKNYDKAITDLTQAAKLDPNKDLYKKNLETVKTAQAASAPSSAPAASAANDIRVCPQCGAALKAAAKFCGSCGAKFEAQPAGKFCPNCGNPVSATARFCGNCRTKVS